MKANEIQAMDHIIVKPTRKFHVVAMPYLGRGHINPMMNFCKLLSLKSDGILISFVLTDEWLDFSDSETKLDNIRFVSIPNVVPSKLDRTANMLAFIKATFTKMEAPFERLLDRLEPPATTIITDAFLPWTVVVGNRRNIPVASLRPMSATVFSMLHHLDLLVQNGHFPIDLSERGDERVDYIPGIFLTRIVDFPTILHEKGGEKLQKMMQIMQSVSKSQYLQFTTIYELEAEVIHAIRAKFSFPIYPVGPTIPYFKLEDNSSRTKTTTTLVT